MRSVRCAVTRGAIAAQRVCRPARAFSTSRVEDGQPQHEYLAAFHNTMDELALLGYCAGADLTEHKQFIDAVVLPLRRTYAWGVPSAHALQAIGEPSEKRLYSRLLKILDSSEKIPYIGRVLNGLYYNFWEDETHVRGIWRRCTLDECVVE